MDNKTHHCVESAPNLPHPVFGAMGGLINEKYPIVCGGVNLENQTFYDECHIFDIEGGLVAPILPLEMAYSGHAVVNNSLLWISGGVYWDDITNYTISHTSW